MTEALALKQESIVFSLKLLLEGEAGSVSRWDLHGNLTLVGKSGFKLQLSLYNNYFFHLIPMMSCLCSSRSFSTIISHAQLDMPVQLCSELCTHRCQTCSRLHQCHYIYFCQNYCSICQFLFSSAHHQSTLILTNFV